MKAGLWLITTLMLIVWTAGMAATAQLAQWLALQLPQWVETMPPAAQWPWPTWLSLWVEPAVLQALQSFLIWLVDIVKMIIPSPQGLGTLLSVLVWLMWGLGALTLLGVALVAHLLIRRRQRRHLSAV